MTRPKSYLTPREVVVGVTLAFLSSLVLVVLMAINLIPIEIGTGSILGIGLSVVGARIAQRENREAELRQKQMLETTERSHLAEDL